MRVLLCGDIIGRSGREAIAKYIPRLKQDYYIDFIIANGENAAAGFGITADICKELYKSGIDVITTGNHFLDQQEIVASLSNFPTLLRPLNYPETYPGRGWCEVVLPSTQQKILVINSMGRLYLDYMLDDPFKATQALLNRTMLGKTHTAILVDFHAETTSEKMGFAHYFDGKVSAVVGTHTHVPTADAQLLPLGTAYQTDLGMCGDYDSIIGMQKEIALARMVNKVSPRFKAAVGEATLCGVLVEIEEKTGKALSIQPIRLGGKLAQALPHVHVKQLYPLEKIINCLDNMMVALLKFLVFFYENKKNANQTKVRSKKTLIRTKSA